MDDDWGIRFNERQLQMDEKKQWMNEWTNLKKMSDDITDLEKLKYNDVS